MNNLKELWSYGVMELWSYGVKFFLLSAFIYSFRLIKIIVQKYIYFGVKGVKLFLLSVFLVQH